MSKKKPPFKTAIGTAGYPWLNAGSPDVKFNKSGEYKVDLVVAAKDATKLVEDIEALLTSEFGEKALDAKRPYREDPDSASGEIIFRIKTSYAPKMVDAKGKHIPEDAQPKLYGGSRLVCYGSVNIYNINAAQFGSSLQLHTVQIAEAVTSTQSFDAIEGSYEHSEESAAEDSIEIEPIAQVQGQGASDYL